MTNKLRKYLLPICGYYMYSRFKNGKISAKGMLLFILDVISAFLIATISIMIPMLMYINYFSIYILSNNFYGINTLNAYELVLEYISYNPILKNMPLESFLIISWLFLGFSFIYSIFSDYSLYGKYNFRHVLNKFGVSIIIFAFLGCLIDVSAKWGSFADWFSGTSLVILTAYLVYESINQRKSAIKVDIMPEDTILYFTKIDEKDIIWAESLEELERLKNKINTLKEKNPEFKLGNYHEFLNHVTPHINIYNGGIGLARKVMIKNTIPSVEKLKEFIDENIIKFLDNNRATFTKSDLWMKYTLDNGLEIPITFLTGYYNINMLPSYSKELKMAKADLASWICGVYSLLLNCTHKTPILHYLELEITYELSDGTVPEKEIYILSFFIYPHKISESGMKYREVLIRPFDKKINPNVFQ